MVDLQALQIPADGLRDGSLGDDPSSHRTQEGFQVDILPQA